MSAFEARTHLGELMDYVRTSKNPCLIERHGWVAAVLLDSESYDRLQLSQKYRRWVEQATEQIQLSYQPEKIILFGSVARGEIREGSDIDLLIIKKTSKRYLERIEEVLGIVDSENPIEPHVYTPQEIDRRLGQGDPFLKQILQQGVTLYETPQ